MGPRTPCFFFRRSAGAPLAAIVSVVSETFLAHALLVMVHLIACLNLVLIGALAWTKS